MKNAVFNSLFLFLLSCGPPLPHIEGLDANRWKRDRNACLGNRKPMTEALDSQKEKLIKLAEVQIISLLGRPDQNELLERNKKSYTYYLEPGPDCENPSHRQKKLILRFNAIGVVREVLIR